MTLTLAQARTVVADHLDDESNVRWSTTQIDRALQYALSMCQNDYCGAGGDRFDIIADFTTSTTGAADLSSVSPLLVRNVNLLVASRYWHIPEIKHSERNVDDNEARTLQIKYVRTYEIPSTTSHPLVGVGATAAPSWDAFDHWICARAALFCSVKDAEGRPELRAVEQDLKQSVLLTPKVPKAVGFPDAKSYWSNWFSWFWIANGRTVKLTRMRA